MPDPTALDTSLVPTAYALLQEFGQDAVHTKKASKTYDPATLEVTEGIDVIQNVKISPPTKYSLFYIASGAVKQGEVVTYLSPENLDFLPEQDHTFTLNGVVYTLLKVDPIYSGNFIAIYEISLKA